MQLGRVIYRLHYFGSSDGEIDIGAVMLMIYNAVDERIYLRFVEIVRSELRLAAHEHAVLDGIDNKALAVFEPYTGFVADEIDICLILADVLRPRAVEGYGRTVGSDDAGNGIVNIENAVLVGGILRPHVRIDIVFYVLAELAERLARCGQGLGLAAAIENEVEIMHTPVYQRAAAGRRLAGEVAADAGNGAVRAEARIDMIFLAELACVYKILYVIDRVAEAVAHADVENSVRLMGDSLHLERLREHARGGLLAENILARSHEVYSYDRVQVIMGADGNRIKLRIVKYLVIVIDRFSAAVFFDRSVRSLGDNIAEILYLRLFVFHVRGDMRRVRYRAAADYRNLDFF